MEGGGKLIGRYNRISIQRQDRQHIGGSGPPEPGGKWDWKLDAFLTMEHLRFPLANRRQINALIGSDTIQWFYPGSTERFNPRV